MNSHLERLRQELEDAMGGGSASGLRQAPAGKWNAAQILEHLFLTYTATIQGTEKCLEQGAPRATRATLKDRVATLMVVKLGYFPARRKGPERVMPRGMPPEEVRQAIVPELQRMALGLDACERRFGTADENHGPPFPGTFHGRRVAQVPLGPRAASCAADSAADGETLMQLAGSAPGGDARRSVG
ncbi:MAG: hypothetical protein WA804_23480, partial [Terriglobales bacterium]